MRFLRRALLGLVVLLLAAAATFWYLHRRPLPAVSGTVHHPGLQGRVEIVRDRWGVPHIFAGSDRDAYFGLGYAVAQDRLFQLELHRRIGQGRLAELFGKAALPADRLFLTMGLQRIGKRQFEAAPPEVRESFVAYAEGVNAAVRDGGGRRPIELMLLGQEFQPARPEDFLGVIGYMAWTLNISWEFDPLYEELVAKVGEEKAARLFPYDRGGDPAVFGAPPAARARTLTGVLDFLHGPWGGPAGSNTWAVAPQRSASGHALLANDPHLTHGLPSLWYEAHLHTPNLDVAGVTLPGLPFVVIGRNRRVAWGLTNLMLDAADFFVERVEGDRVMHKGEWAALGRRLERIPVKGEAPVEMEVLETPHGPLVNHLLEEADQPLAYKWVYAAAEDASELEGFYRLNRARDWASFRAAASLLGAVSQNIAYADVDGHIGLQASGRIPRRQGRWDGNRFRQGWDGRDEWDGFLPFEQMPHTFDPPEGFVAAANNVTWPAPIPLFVSSHWEPMARILRIRERLSRPPRLSVDDLRALHADVTLGDWPPLRESLGRAYAAATPPSDAIRVALDRTLAWDGSMTAESPEAALFGSFYERLFEEIVGDEMGERLTRAYRAKANLWSNMIVAALRHEASDFLDDVRTNETEDEGAIVRRAFARAVGDLGDCCGADPAGWAWGERHQFEFKHPLAAGGAPLRAYFNRGPFPAHGHALTVNKGEFAGGSWDVAGSPSMRQIVDMGRVAESLSAIPAGQSGIPASPHYDDQIALWREVRLHPMLMERAAIDTVAEGVLVLEP